VLYTWCVPFQILTLCSIPDDPNPALYTWCVSYSFLSQCFSLSSTFLPQLKHFLPHFLHLNYFLIPTQPLSLSPSQLLFCFLSTTSPFSLSTTILLALTHFRSHFLPLNYFLTSFQPLPLTANGPKLRRAAPQVFLT
jgi:hypothetical protein